MDDDKVFRHNSITITVYTKGFLIEIDSVRADKSVKFLSFKQYTNHYYKGKIFVWEYHDAVNPYQLYISVDYIGLELSSFILKHVKEYLAKEHDVCARLDVLNAKVEYLTQMLDLIYYAPGTVIEFKRAEERQSEMKG